MKTSRKPPGTSGNLTGFPVSACAAYSGSRHSRTYSSPAASESAAAVSSTPIPCTGRRTSSTRIRSGPTWATGRPSSHRITTLPRRCSACSRYQEAVSARSFSRKSAATSASKIRSAGRRAASSSASPVRQSPTRTLAARGPIEPAVSFVVSVCRVVASAPRTR